MKQFRQLDLILVQQPLNARLDQRRAHARKDGSNSAQQLLVHNRGLREVRDLGRTADVGERGEPEVLKHWTKQYVGAEVLRRRLDALLQLLGGNGLLRNRESPIRKLHRDARSIHQRKQRSGFGRDLHLLVIAVVAHVLVALQHRLVEFGGAVQGVHEQRRRNAMQIRVGGIEEDKPLLAEDARVKFAERSEERR